MSTLTSAFCFLPSDSSSRLHRVVVAVKFRCYICMKLYGFNWCIFRIWQTRQHFQHLLFPNVDGHRKRDARLATLCRIAGFADAMRRRGEDVVADALHVIAGVENDRA